MLALLGRAHVCCSERECPHHCSSVNGLAFPPYTPPGLGKGGGQSFGVALTLVLQVPPWLSPASRGASHHLPSSLLQDGPTGEGVSF